MIPRYLHFQKFSNCKKKCGIQYWTTIEMVEIHFRDSVKNKKCVFTFYVSFLYTRIEKKLYALLVYRVSICDTVIKIMIEHR